MLFPTVAAQSFDSTGIITSLCKSGKRSPLCEVFGQCQQSPLSICQPSQAIGVVNKMCATDFNATAECAPVQSYCQQNNCTTLDPIANAILPAKNTSDMVYLICSEMPMMSDCKTCGPPSNVTGISDCALWDTYSKLCNDMPDMSQCKFLNQFCVAAPSSPYCQSTGSNTQIVSSQPSAQYCTPDKAFCVSGKSVNGSQCFKVDSTSTGWVGFGIGNIMAGADIYMAYLDGTALKIANYLGTGPVQPTLRQDQSSLVSSKLLDPTKLSFEFCRTATVSGKRVLPNSGFIYAYESTKPNNGVFNFHSGGYGSFASDLVNPTKSDAASAFSLLALLFLAFH
ncbi:hypothetical protein EDD86DRAFT_212302 [Gorgonomyces haynaldii]|nr:hypothetical protein EDD86DRAFT_212302 [Gorgonomyces haynaldii]